MMLQCSRLFFVLSRYLVFLFLCLCLIYGKVHQTPLLVYRGIDGAVYGPFDENQVRIWYADGYFPAHTPVSIARVGNSNVPPNWLTIESYFNRMGSNMANNDAPRVREKESARDKVIRMLRPENFPASKNVAKAVKKIKSQVNTMLNQTYRQPMETTTTMESTPIKQKMFSDRVDVDTSIPQKLTESTNAINDKYNKHFQNQSDKYIPVSHVLGVDEKTDVFEGLLPISDSDLTRSQPRTNRNSTVNTTIDNYQDMLKDHMAPVKHSELGSLPRLEPLTPSRQPDGPFNETTRIETIADKQNNLIDNRQNERKASSVSSSQNKEQQKTAKNYQDNRPPGPRNPATSRQYAAKISVKSLPKDDISAWTDDTNEKGFFVPISPINTFERPHGKAKEWLGSLRKLLWRSDSSMNVKQPSIKQQDFQITQFSQIALVVFMCLMILPIRLWSIISIVNTFIDIGANQYGQEIEIPVTNGMESILNPGLQDFGLMSISFEQISNFFRKIAENPQQLFSKELMTHSAQYLHRLLDVDMKKVSLLPAIFALLFVSYAQSSLFEPLMRSLLQPKEITEKYYFIWSIGLLRLLETVILSFGSLMIFSNLIPNIFLPLLSFHGLVTMIALRNGYQQYATIGKDLRREENGSHQELPNDSSRHLLYLLALQQGHERDVMTRWAFEDYIDSQIQFELSRFSRSPAGISLDEKSSDLSIGSVFKSIITLALISMGTLLSISQLSHYLDSRRLFSISMPTSETSTNIFQKYLFWHKRIVKSCPSHVLLLMIMAPMILWLESGQILSDIKRWNQDMNQSSKSLSSMVNSFVDMIRSNQRNRNKYNKIESTRQIYLNARQSQANKNQDALSLRDVTIARVGHKPLLQNLHLRIPYGGILAIMDDTDTDDGFASSALLDVLYGRGNRHLRISGKIELVGQNVTSANEKLGDLISYVVDDEPKLLLHAGAVAGLVGKLNMPAHRQIADVTGAADILSRLSNRASTLLDEGHLTTNEWKALALCRALYLRNIFTEKGARPILLLDHSLDMYANDESRLKEIFSILRQIDKERHVSERFVVVIATNSAEIANYADKVLLITSSEHAIEQPRSS